MIISGNVNLRGALGKSEEGIAMMKMVLDYSHIRWNITKAGNMDTADHPGYKVKDFIQSSAYIIRGLLNPQSLVLENYEGDPYFSQFRAKMEDRGRLGAPSEPDTRKSSLTNMLTRLTGITIEFVREMRSNNVQICVQTILGAEWTYYFRQHYAKYASIKDHYELLVDRLPPYCNLPANRGRTIFKNPVVHRDILMKKKASFEIKPYRK